MKIGIYNRYWNTCGGGENYTGSLAQVLSEYHDVELISVEETDWGRIQSRLRLDLSRCTMVQWPARSCDELSCLTSGYDIFVNSTYSSSMKPLSKKSAIICYFPHKLTSLTRFVSFLRRIKNNTKFQRNVVGNVPNNSFILGGFEVEADGRLWISDIATLPIPRNANKSVSFPLWNGSYEGLYKVACNGDDCPFLISDSKLVVDLKNITSEHGYLTLFCKPFIPSDNGESSDSRRLGLCFDTRKDFFSLIDSDVTINSGTPRDAIKSYDEIISISKFTTSWIKKRWLRFDSKELFPPIDVDSFKTDISIPREKIILTVGRFFAGGHNKKHHEMANAFIKMRSENVIPSDWRLVMIGARHIEHQNHIQYFEDLTRLCDGHPIDIFPDLPFSELLNYYKKSSVYWHSAGWGENVNAFPERFEHFGMTTCEAMASGCIPVVFNGAGQKEIVVNEKTGYLFNDYKSLGKCMGYLTSLHGDPKLLEMRKKAQESICRYSKEAFRNTAISIFNNIISCPDKR